FIQHNIWTIPNLTGQLCIAEKRLRDLGMNWPHVNDSGLIRRPWVLIHIVGVTKAISVGFGMFCKPTLVSHIRGWRRGWRSTLGPVRSSYSFWQCWKTQGCMRCLDILNNDEPGRRSVGSFGQCFSGRHAQYSMQAP